MEAVCIRQNGDLPPKPDDVPSSPSRVYPNCVKGWRDGGVVGTGRIADQKKSYLSYAEAKTVVHGLGLKNGNEWQKYCNGELKHLPQLPHTIPKSGPSCLWDDFKEGAG